MLIDELLRALKVCAPTEKHVALAIGLEQSIRFQTDNVAEYIHRNYEGRQAFYGEREIPNIAPLAPYMWFEYNGLSVGDPSYNQYGCFVSVDYECDGFKTSKWSKVDNIHAETEWILRAQYFGKIHEGYCFSDWIYFYEVSGEGQMIEFRSIPDLLRGPGTPNDYKPDEGQRHKWHEEIIVALTSICFSHCKGTDIKVHQPSRQVRRAAERTGKPVFSFHTIDIQPSTRILNTEGQISKNGLAKALHICRGHFAHYTEEKPLFGKYTGTFYRPMHIRGSKEQGIIGKDYRVHSSTPGQL